MTQALVDRLPPRVRFLPWVGPNYWNRGLSQERLLIIGESHYSGSEADIPGDSRNRNLTRRDIKWQFGPKSWAYFTKVATTMSLRGISSNSDKGQFWREVAFYNYAQRIVGVGARIAPTLEDWKSAQAPLEDVLDVLQPTHVLATGKRLWMNLPQDWGPSARPPLSFEGGNWDLCEGSTRGGRRFWATYIPHPSSFGYSPGRWNPLVGHFRALDPIK